MGTKNTFEKLLKLFEKGCLVFTEYTVKMQEDEQLMKSYKKLKHEGGDESILKIVRKEMMRRRLF